MINRETGEGRQCEKENGVDGDGRCATEDAQRKMRNGRYGNVVVGERRKCRKLLAVSGHGDLEMSAVYETNCQVL